MNKKIYDAINGIDEELVYEALAKPIKDKKLPINKVSLIAAALIVVLLASVFNLTNSMSNSNINTTVSKVTTREIVSNNNTEHSISNNIGIASGNYKAIKEDIEKNKGNWKWLEYNGIKYYHDNFAGTYINGEKKEPDKYLGQTTDFPGSYNNNKIIGSVYSINIVDISDELIVVYEDKTIEILIALS